MNGKLNQVGADVDKAWFVNNNPVFKKENGEVEESLYDDEDKRGVHLNEEGVRMLAENIMKEINFVHHLDKQGKQTSSCVNDSK